MRVLLHLSWIASFAVTCLSQGFPYVVEVTPGPHDFDVLYIALRGSSSTTEYVNWLDVYNSNDGLKNYTLVFNADVGVASSLTEVVLIIHDCCGGSRFITSLRVYDYKDGTGGPPITFSNEINGMDFEPNDPCTITTSSLTTATWDENDSCSSTLSSVSSITPYPTRAPTLETQPSPTDAPTSEPSKAPFDAPTSAPTMAPTIPPTADPTNFPSNAPTSLPTKLPTSVPTHAPTQIPTQRPTQTPTNTPSNAPTSIPTFATTILTAPHGVESTQKSTEFSLETSKYFNITSSKAEKSAEISTSDSSWHDSNLQTTLAKTNSSSNPNNSNNNTQNLETVVGVQNETIHFDDAAPTQAIADDSHGNNQRSFLYTIIYFIIDNIVVFSIAFALGCISCCSILLCAGYRVSHVRHAKVRLEKNKIAVGAQSQESRTQSHVHVNHVALALQFDKSKGRAIEIIESNRRKPQNMLAAWEQQASLPQLDVSQQQTSSIVADESDDELYEKVAGTENKPSDRESAGSDASELFDNEGNDAYGPKTDKTGNANKSDNEKDEDLDFQVAVALAEKELAVPIAGESTSTRAREAQLAQTHVVKTKRSRGSHASSRGKRSRRGTQKSDRRSSRKTISGESGKEQKQVVKANGEEKIEQRSRQENKKEALASETEVDIEEYDI